jgi:PAS domain S-box-containing protein
VGVGLAVARQHSFLLFHTLAELFSIIVAGGIFMLAWNSRRYVENDYLLWVGISYLFIGSLDLVHTLVFRGMDILPGYTTNTPTQLWIAARGLEALTMLLAPVFVTRRLHPRLAFGGFLAATAVVLLSIFSWGSFPTCYDNAAGVVTPFKTGAEHAICWILVAAIVLLWRKRRSFSRAVLYPVLGSMAVTIAAEMIFAHYRDPFGFQNMAGHYFKIVAFYLIYRAIIVVGLTRPYDLLLRDLAQREEALRESEERYRSLVEVSPDAIVVHREGCYVYANPAAARLFGAARPEEVIGRRVLDCIHPEFQELVASRMAALEVGAERTPLADVRLLRFDGSSVEVESAAGRTTFQGEPATQVVMRDVSARKQAERELRTLNETLEQRVTERTAVAEQRTRQLQVLARQLTEAEQHERRRLAVILHDHLQQLLAAARLYVGMARASLEDTADRQALQQAEDLLAESLQTTRSLSVELSPPILHDAGLAPALQWLADHMYTRYELTVRVEADPEAEPLDPEVRSLLFQAVRELLFNVVKHAQVHQATVLMQRRDERLVQVIVTDAGIGFEASHPPVGKTTVGGFGLRHLRGRMEVLGGRLEMHSAPGQGSRFVLIAGLESAPEGSASAVG